MKFTAYTEYLDTLISNHQMGYDLYTDDRQLTVLTPVTNIQATDIDHLK